MSGNRVARELVYEAFLPAQYGQPVGLRLLVRSPTTASHSWSGPSKHSHHTFFPEAATTPSGVRFPFFVGCHCLASSGYRLAREFVADARSPRQNGHPLPTPVR